MHAAPIAALPIHDAWTRWDDLRDENVVSCSVVVFIRARRGRGGGSRLSERRELLQGKHKDANSSSQTRLNSFRISSARVCDDISPLHHHHFRVLPQASEGSGAVT